MATPGQTIYNCVTTDRITFLNVRENTDGQLLQFETIHQPNGIGPIPHRHPFQEVLIKVTKGTLEINIDRKNYILVTGQQILVPKNALHFWSNTGEEELHLLTEMRPALHFQEIIETEACLAQTGKTDLQGRPDLLQWCATMNAYSGELRFPRPPLPFQWFLFGLLGKVLRKAFGFRDSLAFVDYVPENFIRSEHDFIR